MNNTASRPRTHQTMLTEPLRRDEERQQVCVCVCVWIRSSTHTHRAQCMQDKESGGGGWATYMRTRCQTWLIQELWWRERGAGGRGGGNGGVERYTAGVINAQCNQPRQMLRRHGRPPAALKLPLQRRSDPKRCRPGRDTSSANTQRRHEPREHTNEWPAAETLMLMMERERGGTDQSQRSLSLSHTHTGRE